MTNFYYFIRSCLVIALWLSLLPVMAQTGQRFAPLGWSGPYLPDLQPYRDEVLFYSLAKTTIAATPDEACKAGYIASHQLFYGFARSDSIEARAVMDRYDNSNQRYPCEYRFIEAEGEWTGFALPLAYDHVYPACDKYGLLALDYLIQGNNAYLLWKKEWAKDMPAGARSALFDHASQQCYCPAGTKLYSGKGVCAKIASIVIGFFNGVSNTKEAARQSRDRLEVEYGDKYKDTPLKYDLFYNQTACGAGFGKVSCLEDVAEVFEQRSKELDGVFANRWEVFWDILAGRHRADGSLTGRLIGLLGDAGNAFLQWLDSTANAVMNQLASAVLKLLTLFTNAPTYENQAEHLASLTAYADRGSGFILVAHSQGNLFVNSAYDALLAAKPNAEAKVVHVAPASPTLRGEHILADIDLVINGLRTTGINTVPPANIAMPTSSRDVTGHGFEPTYMDKARNAYARTKQLITNSLQALVP